jgi:carbonic anhydrase
MTLNISSENIYGQCSTKCHYGFSYQESNCIAQNDGFSIKITYDKSNLNPVVYNNNKYVVQDINIYAPSIHNFNGAATDAEIVISHYPEITGGPLNVSIPIILSGNTTQASSLITGIIEGVANGAPTQGESVSISLDNFTLNTIVPKNPFYAYTDGSNENWIVYGKEYAISLVDETIKKLQQIIIPLNYIKCPNDPVLFFNQKGPLNSAITSNDIYIDCQPTGSSEEETTTTTTTSENDLFKNPTFQSFLSILIIIVFFMVLLVGVYYGFTAFTQSQLISPH